jgi:hypothetical protein
MSEIELESEPKPSVVAIGHNQQDTLSIVKLKRPVVAVAHNQQDIPLSVVEPKPRLLSKPSVVAVSHNQ